MKKIPMIHHGRALRRSLTTAILTVLSVGVIVAGSNTAEARRPRLIPVRPNCTIPNCVEVHYPANGKTPPTVVRCKQGEPCHPLCTRC